MKKSLFISICFFATYLILPAYIYGAPGEIEDYFKAVDEVERAQLDLDVSSSEEMGQAAMADLWSTPKTHYYDVSKRYTERRRQIQQRFKNIRAPQSCQEVHRLYLRVMDKKNELESVSQQELASGSAPIQVIESRISLLAELHTLEKEIWRKMAEIYPDIRIPDPEVEDYKLRFYTAIWGVEIQLMRYQAQYGNQASSNPKEYAKGFIELLRQGESALRNMKVPASCREINRKILTYFEKIRQSVEIIGAGSGTQDTYVRLMAEAEQSQYEAYVKLNKLEREAYLGGWGKKKPLLAKLGILDALIKRYDENGVRSIMADMSLGGPVNYYRHEHPDDPNSVEAVKRWENGVRVVNANIFERKVAEGKGVVYKGTDRPIDGKDVILTTDKVTEKAKREEPKLERYDESRVRYIMADMIIGGVVGYYRGHTEDSHSVEAVRRWDDGVRVVNADEFERKIVAGNWQITYKGTDRTIDGKDVILTTDKVELAKLEEERKKKEVEEARRLEKERKQKEEQARLEAERKQKEEQARLEAERKEKERPTAVKEKTWQEKWAAGEKLTQKDIMEQQQWQEELSRQDKERQARARLTEEQGRQAELTKQEAELKQKEEQTKLEAEIVPTPTGKEKIPPPKEAPPQVGPDEARICCILLDMQLGAAQYQDTVGYYRRSQPNDPNCVEAVKRWDKGIRVVNIRDFERKVLEGKGLVYKGTDRQVNCMDVILKEEPKVAYETQTMSMKGTKPPPEEVTPKPKEAIKIELPKQVHLKLVELCKVENFMEIKPDHRESISNEPKGYMLTNVTIKNKTSLWLPMRIYILTKKGERDPYPERVKFSPQGGPYESYKFDNLEFQDGSMIRVEFDEYDNNFFVGANVGSVLFKAISGLDAFQPQWAQEFLNLVGGTSTANSVASGGKEALKGVFEVILTDIQEDPTKWANFICAKLGKKTITAAVLKNAVPVYKAAELSYALCGKGWDIYRVFINTPPRYVDLYCIRD